VLLLCQPGIGGTDHGQAALAGWVLPSVPLSDITLRVKVMFARTMAQCRTSTAAD